MTQRSGDSKSLRLPGSVQPSRHCPFCGGSNLWINSDLDPKFVACRTCWAFGPTAPTVTRAIERWHDRATTPAETDALQLPNRGLDRPYFQMMVGSEQRQCHSGPTLTGWR